MPNLRMSVNADGCLVVNDDLPARSIVAGSGISVTQSGSDITVALASQTPLTAQDTTLTHTAPGTPDYVIQELTLITPYGFKTADEGHTVLKVIANLQTRVAELEARLQSAGLL